MDKDKALKLALEALKKCRYRSLADEIVDPAIAAIKEALAQPEQEPLTDDECDAIYTALDAWAKEVDSYDFGLPTLAGGGRRAGRAIIRAAHGIKGS